MNNINEILKELNLKPRKYVKKNKVLFIETEEDKYAIKRKSNNEEIYEYLISRNFEYMPKIVGESDEYYITKFIDEYKIPKEQKIVDMIDLVSLLHNKTTHYKEVTVDDYKEIYEDLKNNIEYLYGYYMDLISIIETHVFMSPSEYTLARNISKILSNLGFIDKELDRWYEIVKNKKRKRLVVLHNNLKLDHFIVSDKFYLTSWDKAKIDSPVFDLYKLYLNHGLEYDFSSILKRYEKKYPLYEDERILFFILIFLPKKIELNKSEYENTKEVANMIDLIYKTEYFISPYYSKERKENDTNK